MAGCVDALQQDFETLVEGQIAQMEIRVFDMETVLIPESCLSVYGNLYEGGKEDAR